MLQSDNWAVVIPARYKSSRLPGKPLAKILGISLIERVWAQCIKAVPCSKVYVATDDERIFDHVINFGGQAIMTAEECLTGTDRVHEAALKLGLTNVINIQGDEPLISPDIITLFVEKMMLFPSSIFNGMAEIRNEDEFRSCNVPKVVTSASGRLLYMSRASIPTNKTLQFKKAFKQVCIYAFPVEKLGHFVKQKNKTHLEDIEDIEILRFLEKDIEVTMIQLPEGSIAVDIPQDIEKVERVLINAAK